MDCAAGLENKACDRQQTSQAAHCHHIVRPCAEDAELREAVSPLMKLFLSFPTSNAPKQKEVRDLAHGHMGFLQVNCLQHCFSMYTMRKEVYA